MRLIAGCPIAHRAWAIPTWMACLAAQTRPPDGLLFVHSGQEEDDTWQTILREAGRHGFKTHIAHDRRTPHQRHDNDRFMTLADLRNQMLDLAVNVLPDVDLFLSLDSDVMLENPRTIEQLERMIVDGHCDIASPVTWLHPHGEGSWAYNAGWWTPGGSRTHAQRAWRRLPPEKVAWGDVIPIDIPMAAFLMNRTAMRCRYRWHESGEDLGLAQDLERAGIRCLWDTDLKARHIWCEQDLEPQETAA